jgi:hypothetical protein
MGIELVLPPNAGQGFDQADEHKIRMAIAGGARRIARIVDDGDQAEELLAPESADDWTVEYADVTLFAVGNMEWRGVRFPDGAYVTGPASRVNGRS